MSDDRLLTELVRAARELETEREKFESSSFDDELSRSLTELEQQELVHRVVPRSAQRKLAARAPLVIVSAIAAAIAVALIFRTGDLRELPEYRVAVLSDSYSGVRSPGAGRLRVADGMSLDLVLRPEV